MDRENIIRDLKFNKYSSGATAYTISTPGVEDSEQVLLKEGNHQVLITERNEDGKDGQLYVFEVNVSYMQRDQDNTGVIVSYEDSQASENVEGHRAGSIELSEIEASTASAAHEIRNPLSSLRGFLQLLDGSFSEEDARKDYIKIMLSEIDRISRLVNDFLRISRRREHRIISLRELIVNLVKVFEVRFKDADINCHVKIQEGSLNILGDEDGIIQVLTNLLQNSCEATGKGRNIWISAQSQGDNVIVEIRNEGEGIEPSDMDKLFEPFFSTKKSGTGLGLYITKQIVEAHKGKIWAESELGLGATFYLSFPGVKE